MDIMEVSSSKKASPLTNINGSVVVRAVAVRAISS